MPETSVTLLGDLSKPASTLIEKISEALGGAFRPWQLRRIAAAEADVAQVRATAEAAAKLILKRAELDADDLSQRAAHRLIGEELRKQVNIDRVIDKALPNLAESAKPENIANDWLVNFFEKCRLVSDDQIQEIWARILAGEANAAGTFARRTMSALYDMEREDAISFSRLCSFCWTVNGQSIPLVFDTKDAVYIDNALPFATLLHLADIGLIQFNNAVSFTLGGNGLLPAFYFDRHIVLKVDPDRPLDVGHVVLTRTGSDLARVCVATPVDEFFQYVEERWRKSSMVVATP